MGVIRAPGTDPPALLVSGAMFSLSEELHAFGSNSQQALAGTPVTLHLQANDCDTRFQTRRPRPVHDPDAAG